MNLHKKNGLFVGIMHFGIGALLLFPELAQAGATISLKAVAKNGNAITPASSLDIQPGDVIAVDIFLSDWNNPPFDGGSGLVRLFQVTVQGRSGALSSGACGPCNSEYVLPIGWDAPLIARDSCPCDNPCFPICDSFHGCIGPDFDRDPMAGINDLRTDWLFHGHDTIRAVDASTPNVRWGAVTFSEVGQTASRCSGGSAAGWSCAVNSDCPGGTCDPGFQSYLGTLYLKAGSSICGSYSFNISTNDGGTFISNGAPSAPHFIPGVQGLTLTNSTPCAPGLGACCTEEPENRHCDSLCDDDCMGANQRFGGLGSTCDDFEPPCSDPVGACCIDDTGACEDAVREVDCEDRWGGIGSTCDTLDPPCVNQPIAWNPGNCVVDARRPQLVAGQPQGYTSWVWTFQSPRTSSEDSPADFVLRQVPASEPPSAPTIESVIPGSDNTAHLRFSAPIQPNKWTCVKHIASGVEKCLGYLPGDADNNHTAAPADILKIIDNLNGLVNPPLPLHQCDIDRSGICHLADILAEIDLLKGANGLPTQNGLTLGVCPTP